MALEDKVLLGSRIIWSFDSIGDVLEIELEIVPQPSTDCLLIQSPVHLYYNLTNWYLGTKRTILWSICLLRHNAVSGFFYQAIFFCFINSFTSASKRIQIISDIVHLPTIIFKLLNGKGCCLGILSPDCIGDSSTLLAVHGRRFIQLERGLKEIQVSNTESCLKKITRENT
jgi:hypothetical protein